ncbi:hypothetical protein ASA1KI_27120 [Opitutales bacterium ASA1]|uniref:hypothetical protein n=1 Tax=Congregicoccus parvus TaxID=3081749 RepID=UPI002B2E4E7F|nr:hypothetical protein ASA1KI_27120 [Opitutales bacterium ASA1]
MRRLSRNRTRKPLGIDTRCPVLALPAAGARGGHALLLARALLGLPLLMLYALRRPQAALEIRRLPPFAADDDLLQNPRIVAARLRFEESRIPPTIIGCRLGAEIQPWLELDNLDLLLRSSTSINATVPRPTSPPALNLDSETEIRDMLRASIATHSNTAIVDTARRKSR